jgi:hypothetical protein
MRRIVLGVVALLAAGPAAAKDCDRACLGALADAVLTALQTGEPGKVLPRSLRITENGRDIRAADSQIRAVSKVTYRHDFAEPAAGAVGVHGAAQAAGGPAVFALRLKVKDARVTELETVVTRRTEAAVFSPQSMSGKPAWDQDLPPARRTAREAMVAAANAYFDGIEAESGENVPAAPGCNRYENGVQTTNRPGGPQEGCKGLAGFGYIERVRDRRFPLVDPDRGLAWGLAVFDIPGGPYEVKAADGQVRKLTREPRSVLVSELFKLDAGQIQDIEVVMRNLPLGATPGWAPPKAKKK